MPPKETKYSAVPVNHDVEAQAVVVDKMAPAHRRGRGWARRVLTVASLIATAWLLQCIIQECFEESSSSDSSTSGNSEQGWLAAFAPTGDEDDCDHHGERHHSHDGEHHGDHHGEHHGDHHHHDGHLPPPPGPPGPDGPHHHHGHLPPPPPPGPDGPPPPPPGPDGPHRPHHGHHHHPHGPPPPPPGPDGPRPPPPGPDGPPSFAATLRNWFDSSSDESTANEEQPQFLPQVDPPVEVKTTHVEEIPSVSESSSSSSDSSSSSSDSSSSDSSSSED